MDLTSLLILLILDYAHCTMIRQNALIHKRHIHHNGGKCTISVCQNSVNYFAERLQEIQPDFARFYFQFNSSVEENIHASHSVFQPFQWVWTYKTHKGVFPYVHWNFDYSLLSFGLLDSKTIQATPEMFLNLDLSPDCNFTFGDNESVTPLAKALLSITKHLPNSSKIKLKYEFSYYCYCVVNMDMKDSFQYHAAVYFLYPINFFTYKCCYNHYRPSKNTYDAKCSDESFHNWPQTTILPYIIGILIFLYFPLVIIWYSAYISRQVTVLPTNREYEEMNENDADTEDDILIKPSVENSDEWIYLNGESPKTLFILSENLWCGLQKSHPILTSRIRRMLFLFYAPGVLFVQLYFYDKYIDGQLIAEMIETGRPMGFLTLLVEAENKKNFAPHLGGAFCLLLAYFILGILFLVCPYSLKQIIEDGLPGDSCNERSPLCFGANKIKLLSMVPRQVDDAYGECNNIIICGMYMLFCGRFWRAVFDIQKDRFKSMTHHRGLCRAIFVFVVFFFYVFICFIEIIVCIIWYGQPFLRLVCVIVKGYVENLLDLWRSGRRSHNRLTNLLMNPIVFAFGSMTIFLVYLYFMYSMCLIFLQIFTVFSNMVVYCFLSIIIYPSYSFGYLFFFGATLYYIIHLISKFGQVYLDLLTDALEVVETLDRTPCNITLVEDKLAVSNLAFGRLRSVSINETDLETPQNTLDCISTFRQKEFIIKNGFCGIRRRLYDELVKRYRPVHPEVVKLFLKLIAIVFLLAVTVSVTAGFTTGPANEISEVMHVIFTVAVGALPRVLEVFLGLNNENGRREIERRHIEQTILDLRLKSDEENQHG